MESLERISRRNIKLIVDNEIHAAVLPVEEKAGSKEDWNRWPICGLPVESFLQVIAMDQQTCILEVYQSSDQQGCFYIVQGDLFDAVCIGKTGEEAAMEIISWQNVRLNIRQIINTSGLEKKIDKSLMSIMMEYSRRRDEALEEKEEEKKEEWPKEKNNADQCLSFLRENMGDALITASIIHIHTGRELASHHDKTMSGNARFFGNLTQFIRNAFAKTTDQNHLGDHYIIHLKEEQTLMVYLFNNVQLGIIFKHAKCSLGLVQKAVIPKIFNLLNAETV